MSGPLPTRREMFLEAYDELTTAYRALGDAADWLRSDWTPADSALTAVQAAARTGMLAAIGAAKAAINQAKDVAGKAIDEGR